MNPQPITPLNIGLIGLGSISESHIEAYQQLSFPVVAACDISPSARDKFAEKMPETRLYERFEDLIDDPNVQIIDLTTPHHRSSRVPIIEKSARAEKPVFIQKPLAMCYDDALEIVELLEAQNVSAMVNQNMCFTYGGLALASLLVDQKVIGKPFLTHIELRDYYEWNSDHWYGKDDRWWIMVNTVHHLSLLHLIFGPPETVYAVTGKDSALKGVLHDGYGNLILKYTSGLNVSVLSTGTYYGNNPKPFGYEEFWIQGTSGLIDCQILNGITIRQRKEKKNPKEECHKKYIPTKTNWLPDAIGQGMLLFKMALASENIPICSVQDNLYVMAVVEAAYQSSIQGSVIHLSEIMKDRYQPDYGPGWLHGQKPSVFINFNSS